MKLKLGLRGMYRQVAIGILSGLLCSPCVYAHISSVSVSDLLVEAKSKYAEGDHEGAANAYKQILEVDADHREARLGLAKVLMKAEVEAHHSDQSDAVKAVVERTSLVE